MGSRDWRMDNTVEIDVDVLVPREASMSPDTTDNPWKKTGLGTVMEGWDRPIFFP